MRKLLLLTAFVMSFAARPSPKVFRLSLPLTGRSKGFTGGSTWLKKRGILTPKVWM